MRRETNLYTHGHHDSVLRSHRSRTAENSAAYLLPELEPGLRLCDVGCGPGTITRDLARLVAPGRVVAVDAAAGILDEARTTCRNGGVDNVEFHQADAGSLPFDDGSFDVVHAHQVLQHVSHPVAVLEEMGRICRAGGIVAAREGDYHGETWWPREPMLERWLELYTDVARANGGEPDAGRRLASWAREAGYAKVRVTASVWLASTPETCQWWADLWAERTTASTFAARALELGLTDAEELSRIADGWRRWAASPDAWLAFLHAEILAEA
ncbi:MAG: methyltransferase domain-containing protein [Acidimicrobiales bacterium]